MESRFYSFQIFPQNCKKKKGQVCGDQEKITAIENCIRYVISLSATVVAFGEMHFFYAPNEALVWLEKNEEKIRRKQQDQERHTRDVE